MRAGSHALKQSPLPFQEAFFMHGWLQHSGFGRFHDSSKPIKQVDKTLKKKPEK